MTERFEDVLDAALEAIKSEPVTAVLTRHPHQAESLAPLLMTAELLGDGQTAVQPQPDPDWQATDRAAFLAQIDQLPATAVSTSPLLRLKGWLRQSRPARHNEPSQKERKLMNALIARAVATAVVIFSIGGGTVALANDSLPDTPLYPVKLMVEETRMAMADSPAEQAALQMTLAQVRLQEMTQLMQAGDQIDEPLTDRLETHLQQALQQTAQLGDPEMIGLLTQMQTMLQNQQQTMAQLGDPTQAMFGQINQIMNRYQEQAQAGLEDPSTFRWRHSQDPNWEPPCLEEGCEPAGNSNQYGQDEDNGQYGPGPGGCIGDCEPNGSENQYGQDNDNSQNDNGSDAGNPGSANGPNGPGDGTCLGDCDPVGEQSHTGQEDDHAGQTGPGDSDGVCTNDCDPLGDGPHPDHGSGHGNGG